jgi:hypothetical protein
MTVLANPGGAAWSETSLVRQEHQDAAFAGALAVAAAGRGDNADRNAGLQRPRRAGPASAAPRVFLIRGGQLRQITNDHTIGVLAWSADLLALVLARHLDGRPDRRYGSAGRRPIPAVHLICPELSGQRICG